MIACPGRPFVCVRPEDSCVSISGPWLCPTDRSVFCGLQRDDSGKLLVGSEGLPVPNCVSATDASAAACGRQGIKPLPTNLTGGSGSSQGWDALYVSGRLPSGSSAGVIASIGSDGYSGGPAYFAGNGSDATVVVKVSHTFIKSVLLSLLLCIQFIVSPVADSVLQCVLCSTAAAAFCVEIVMYHEITRSSLTLMLHLSGTVLLRNRYPLDVCFHRFCLLLLLLP